MATIKNNIQKVAAAEAAKIETEATRPWIIDKDGYRWEANQGESLVELAKRIREFDI